jgi:hypothetical protein
MAFQELPSSCLAFRSHVPYLMNVKRFLSILLLALYVALAAGVTIQHHTCGGTTTVDLSPVPLEDPCGCDDTELPSERCCTVEIKAFQLHDDQSVPAVVTFPMLDATPVQYFAIYTPLYTSSFTTPFFVDTSPPRAVSATILNCAFLI